MNPILENSLLPDGFKPPVPLTAEDREIIRVRKAGLTCYMDRLDATDMLFYAQLRSKMGMPRETMAVGVSTIIRDLDRQMMGEIMKSLEQHRSAIEGHEEAPSHKVLH